MTRIMYDGITPARLPAGAAIYASYVDGHWPNFPELAQRFPNALHVSIAVDPDHDARVLDVEKYDALPEQAPAWAARQRHRGMVPVVYCSESIWGAVRSAFHRQGVASPLWWIANYNRTKNDGLIPGTIAVQYDSQDGFDSSVVANTWPGLDVTPHKPKPHPHPERDHRVVRAGDTLSAIAASWGVSLAVLERANPHAGHPAGTFDNIWPGDVIYRP